MVSILSGLHWYFLQGWYTCIGLDCHEDVITWHHFPHYWPFARGIPRPLVDSPNKGSVMRSFHVFIDFSLNKLLNKQSEGWWTEAPWRSCDVEEPLGKPFRPQWVKITTPQALDCLETSGTQNLEFDFFNDNTSAPVALQSYACSRASKKL